MVGLGDDQHDPGQRAGTVLAAEDVEAVVDLAVSSPRRPDGLARIARLGSALLRAPVQVVAVSGGDVELLATTPRETPPVPDAVARRLAIAHGSLTVVDPDGWTWTGAGGGRRDRSPRVVVCARGADDDGPTRAALLDLAAVAADVRNGDRATAEAADLQELVATCSHDLRSPLSVLRAALETMTVQRELPDDQAESIAELALRQARRMETMLDGLLSLHGLDEEPREDSDLVALAREAVDAGRVGHERVDVQLEEPLPPTPVLVHAAPGAISRVFENLVTNAAVHGGDRVLVGVEVVGDEAEFRVSDDGPGMPDDSPLVTGVRADRSGGHGLGLVISQRIVDAHGGTIEHAPRPGGGTTVRVRLDLAH